MSGNNGLFDSEDEDDIQYNNLDESEELATTPKDSYPSPDPATSPLKVAPPAPVPAGNPIEEEKIQTNSYPSAGPPTAPLPPPAPVVTTPPVHAPIPTPVPVDATPLDAEPVDAALGDPELEDSALGDPIQSSISPDDIDSIFTVTDPVKAGYVSYTVRGRDEDGDFEGQRRYNDFYYLRSSLVKRWPGTFIPAIPSKKAVGNKDDKYVEYRRHFLQRFLRKVANLPHILNSDEFKIFSRPSGDVEKMLNMLPKMTPEALVERYKLSLHIDEFPDEALVKQ